jgi:L-rhamnose-H+ transport protein
MATNTFSGIMLIALGAFASGSFAVPFSRIRNWKWEKGWLIYSAGAYLLFPLLVCLITSPSFIEVYLSVPPKTLLFVFILGIIYGIGNLSFGLSLRFLGLSLGYALSLGLMLAIGTLIPPVIDGRLGEMMSTSCGDLLLAGVIVAFIGIAISGGAGFLKDRNLSDEKKRESVSEFNLIKGIMALFAYFEYTGKDFKADMAKMAAHKKTQEWWNIMEPMQDPLPSGKAGEWWSNMEEVFHMD